MRGEHCCGMNDAQCAEWQAELEMSLIINDLHESVSDLNEFVTAAYKSNVDEFGLIEISEDVYGAFEPLLKELKRANRGIRKKHGIKGQNLSLPSDRADFTRR
jgi:hypothetical protein